MEVMTRKIKTFSGGDLQMRYTYIYHTTHSILKARRCLKLMSGCFTLIFFHFSHIFVYSIHFFKDVILIKLAIYVNRSKTPIVCYV